MPKYLDGAGLARFWDNIQNQIGSASQEQVNAWLTAHPEATTTVQDGAVTTAKLADGAVTDAKLVQTGGVLERVGNLSSDFDSKFYEIAAHIKSRNLYDGTATSGYIAADGTIYSSSTYHYSDKIDVSDYVGKTLYFGQAGVSASVRFLCAYNDSGVAVEASGSNTSVSSYIVPSGIKWIVITFSSTAATFSVEPDYLSSQFTSYYDRNIVKKYPPVDGAVNIPKPTILTADELTHGNSLMFNTYNSIKRGGQVFEFYCKIPNGLDDDGYLVIGKNTANGYAFGVSNTKWNYFVDGSAIGAGNLHGLTLKDYVAVRIVIKDDDGIAYINIQTNGGSYSRTNTSWSGVHGHPYFLNSCTATITNVVFTWTAESFRRRIWIFGDSYVSIANTRWPYYLYNWGFSKNILINGYPGEQSRLGFLEWREALNYGTPSIAIWAYGMNNADDNSINADWLTYVRLFIKNCEDLNIVPILATIPCTPTADNSYKNAWIRESGYRYIEFANTVNTAQDATTWYDDMLNSDNVHPNESGAIALACRAISDVPEIMIN